jgi:hypothetical protein
LSGFGSVWPLVGWVQRNPLLRRLLIHGILSSTQLEADHARRGIASSQGAELLDVALGPSLTGISRFSCNTAFRSPSSLVTRRGEVQPQHLVVAFSPLSNGRPGADESL